MKNIGVIILIIVLIGLAVYLYLGLTECKTIATTYGEKLQECALGLETCVIQAGQCQEALINLEGMCAPYLSQELPE